MLKGFKQRVREALYRRSLTPEAKDMLLRDQKGVPSADPGSARTIAGAIRWLGRAQDKSLSADGGAARAFSLIHGWTSSYPETTGYIIPTLLDYAKRTGEVEWSERARRMLDWLAAIQLSGGGFQGGRIDSKPLVPVVFNTGQILLGLARGELEFGAYEKPLRRAADWLVQAQDSDGCWRRFQSPFAGAGDKAYDTHTAWGLLEADRVVPGHGYAEAALANVRWALTCQQPNGWMANCCLSNALSPLTHTLGYALRGIVEAYRYSRDPVLLAAARLTADGLLFAQRSDGFLAGKLRADWSADAGWAGLAGIAQIAVCWLMIYQDTGDRRYLEAGVRSNQYVRRTVLFDGVSADVAGAVKGSFPIDGAYCRFEFPNWATKFLVDSLVLEGEIGAEDQTHGRKESSRASSQEHASALVTHRSLRCSS